MYAPTNDKEETIKEEFNNMLQNVLNEGRGRHIIILMGDFNAKIGGDNNGFEETVGKHGLGEMNENGEMMANLCAINEIVIGGRLFPNRRIYTATWISQDHKTDNQIDHVCINRKFRIPSGYKGE
jgi:endonuclease/exonuclease/phosphatase family metal-dependent hydrolase